MHSQHQYLTANLMAQAVEYGMRGFSRHHKTVPIPHRWLRQFKVRVRKEGLAVVFNFKHQPMRVERDRP